MATLQGKIIADFSIILATELSIGATTATLSSATDDDGVALPAGRYFFTLDSSNSSKEHISCDLSGTALTNIKTVSRQGIETAGVLRKHRIGSSVSITDFAHILQINNLLNGTTDLNASTPLKYDGTATISNSNSLATKKYVDDTAIAGAPDSSTAVKGIVKMSIAPTSATNPIAVGDNDGRLPTQNENDALVGTSGTAVSSSNKLVDNADTIGTGSVLRTSLNRPVTNIQEFSSSGTWTKPTGAIKILIQGWAAGGGGGGGGGATRGGGGGGGAYKETWFSASSLNATESVVVGVAGTGGASNTSGTVGGNTTFKTFTIYGGGGGGGVVSFNGGGGGGGGSTGAGQTSGGTSGAIGGNPISGAIGGDSLLGGGGGGNGTSAPYTAGISYFGGTGGTSGASGGTGGAGGFGGSYGTGGTGGTGAGANGSNGFLIITTFF